MSMSLGDVVLAVMILLGVWLVPDWSKDKDDDKEDRR